MQILFKEDMTFLVSKILQESITKTDTIASPSIDHSLILFVLKLDKESQKGRGLWKFDNSKLSDENFVLEMKGHIAMPMETLKKIYLMTR